MLKIIFAIIVIINVIICYCCCAAAGRADAAMEKIWEKRMYQKSDKIIDALDFDRDGGKS